MPAEATHITAQPESVKFVDRGWDTFRWRISTSALRSTSAAAGDDVRNVPGHLGASAEKNDATGVDSHNRPRLT